MLIGTDIDIVREAYYGKPKQLAKIEPEMDKLIRTIRGNGDGKMIQKSESLKKIERAFADAFNLRSYTLIVNSVTSAPNATTPVSIFKNLQKDSSKLDVVTILDKSLIASYDLTAEETIAILLHEMGHNFDRSAITIIGKAIPWRIILNPDKQVSVVVGGIIGHFVGNAIATSIWNIIGKVKGYITGAIERMPQFAVALTQIQSVIYSIMSAFPPSISLRMRSAIFRFVNDPSRVITGYAGEKYADSFASAYGYSVELATAMRKMNERHQVTKYVKHNKLISIVLDISKVASSIPFILLDEHPDSSTRVYSALQKMKRELDDPTVPKEFKAEIAKQVDELEKLVEDMIDTRSDANKHIWATTLFNKIWIGTFKGKLDPREMLQKIWGVEE